MIPKFSNVGRIGFALESVRFFFCAIRLDVFPSCIILCVALFIAKWASISYVYVCERSFAITHRQSFWWACIVVLCIIFHFSFTNHKAKYSVLCVDNEQYMIIVMQGKRVRRGRQHRRMLYCMLDQMNQTLNEWHTRRSNIDRQTEASKAKDGEKE